MSIIFGFGATEEKVRREVKESLSKNGEGIIKEYNEQADKFDKLSKEEAPERYTRIFFYDNTLTFHHINRKHPFSPDGWAMMEIKEPFGVKQ